MGRAASQYGLGRSGMPGTPLPRFARREDWVLILVPVFLSTAPASARTYPTFDLADVLCSEGAAEVDG